MKKDHSALQLNGPVLLWRCSDLRMAVVAVIAPLAVREAHGCAIVRSTDGPDRTVLVCVRERAVPIVVTAVVSIVATIASRPVEHEALTAADVALVGPLAFAEVHDLAVVGTDDPPIGRAGSGLDRSDPADLVEVAVDARCSGREGERSERNEHHAD